MRVTPASRARVIWCTVNGTPATGSIGFGVLMVSGRRRVPCPPTRSTASVTPQGCHTPAGDGGYGADVTDVWSLLQRRRRESAGAPLVTFLDAGTGERTELSAVSVENAAAKIANALRDEYDLGPGAAIGLRLPLHWQRSAWCAGAWTAGCVVDARRRRR